MNAYGATMNLPRFVIPSRARQRKMRSLRAGRKRWRSSQEMTFFFVIPNDPSLSPKKWGGSEESLK